MGEEAQIEAGWDLDGFQSDRRRRELKLDRKDLLDVHQQRGTISSVLQSALKQKKENRSDYFLAFILKVQPPYFNSCDERGRHSLLEVGHRRVQAQYFHYLLVKSQH